MEEFLDKNPIENKGKSTFYSIFDLKKGLKFIPDISMYKYLFNDRIHKESKFGIKIGQGVCILPGKLTRALTIIPAMKRYFSENKDYALVNNYDEALTAINNFKQLPAKDPVDIV